MKFTIKDKLFFLGLFLTNIFFIIIGFFILPIAVLFREPTANKNSGSNQEKFKCNWLNKIYGNEYDGFGDIYYKRDFPEDTYWSRLNWCMLRNPVHNFALRTGVYNKEIVKIETFGNPNVTDDPFEENTGIKIQIATDSDGRTYKMWYFCKLWRQILPFYKGDRGIRILVGYKNFCVKEVPEIYQYSWAVNMTPFKIFVKG